MDPLTKTDPATRPTTPTPTDLVVRVREAVVACARSIHRARQLHAELTRLRHNWKAAIAASRAALARTAVPAERPCPCLRAGLDAVPPRLPTVLVVDSDPIGADIVAAALGVYGFPTRVACCGVRAVALAAAYLPDVVFLDFKGPGSNELAVARRLRSRLTGRRPLVVALTGCMTPKEVERSAAVGIDLFLLKPVDVKELVDLLCKVARGESVTGQFCN